MAARKKRSTWGTKRLVDKGVYELRYSVAGKRKSKRFHETAREADAELARLRIENEGKEGSQTLQTFWADVMLPEHETRVAQGSMSRTTLDGYKSAMRVSVLPAFGNRIMESIKAAEVQEWLSSMSAGSAKRSKAVMRLVLQRAVDLGLLESNVLVRRYIMPSKNTMVRARSKDVYRKAELDDIAVQCQGETLEPAFILAAFGGGTRSEVMGSPSGRSRMAPVIDGRMYALVPIKRGVHRVSGETLMKPFVKNETRAGALVIEPPHSHRLKALLDGIGEGYVSMMVWAWTNP